MREMESYRGLWAGVVLQARYDLDWEPRGSLIYADAHAFFTHDGKWAESRRSIGDYLELQPHELMRLGRKVLTQRAAREAAEAAACQRVQASCEQRAIQASLEQSALRATGGDTTPVELPVETATRGETILLTAA